MPRPFFPFLVVSCWLTDECHVFNVKTRTIDGWMFQERPHCRSSPSEQLKPAEPSFLSHSSLIGLAVGPQPKGSQYKTSLVLKSRVRKEEAVWDPRPTESTGTLWNPVEPRGTPWKHWTMCKGLAALPQTCLERWELHPVLCSVRFSPPIGSNFLKRCF